MSPINSPNPVPRPPPALDQEACAATNDDELGSFLRAIYPADLFDPTQPRSRPFVTLTYAQSLDGKIAGPGGVQIRLSGDESMRLTHRLRELHDSILVGSGTMLSDDPQLNARLPTLLSLDKQPQPIILDARLRTPTSAKLIRNHHARITPQPVILCDADATENRRKALEDAGAIVQLVSVGDTGHISLSAVLESKYIGRSLMVEGGASIISAFLASNLVDLVVITIAPVLIGDGITATQGRTVNPELKHIATKNFGKDVVVVCRPKKAAI